MSQVKPNLLPKPGSSDKLDHRKPAPTVSPKPAVHTDGRRGIANNILDVSGSNQSENPEFSGSNQSENPGHNTGDCVQGDEGLLSGALTFKASSEVESQSSCYDGKKEEKSEDKDTESSKSHLLPPPTKPKPTRSPSPLPPQKRIQTDSSGESDIDKSSNERIKGAKGKNIPSDFSSTENLICNSSNISDKKQTDINDIVKSKPVKPLPTKKHQLRDDQNLKNSKVGDKIEANNVDHSDVVEDSRAKELENMTSDAQEDIYVNASEILPVKPPAADNKENDESGVFEASSNDRAAENSAKSEEVVIRKAPAPPSKPKSKPDASKSDVPSDNKGAESSGRLSRLSQSSSYESALEAGFDVNQDVKESSSEGESRTGEKSNVNVDSSCSTKKIFTRKAPAPPPKKIKPGLGGRLVGAVSNTDLTAVEPTGDSKFGEHLAPNVGPVFRKDEKDYRSDTLRRRSEGFLPEYRQSHVSNRESNAYESVCDEISNVIAARNAKIEKKGVPEGGKINTDSGKSPEPSKVDTERVRQNSENIPIKRDSVDGGKGHKKEGGDRNSRGRDSAASPGVFGGWLFRNSKGKGGNRRASEPENSCLSVFYQPIDTDEGDNTAIKNDKISPNPSTNRISGSISEANETENGEAPKKNSNAPFNYLVPNSPHSAMISPKVSPKPHRNDAGHSMTGQSNDSKGVTEGMGVTKPLPAVPVLPVGSGLPAASGIPVDPVFPEVPVFHKTEPSDEELGGSSEEEYEDVDMSVRSGRYDQIVDDSIYDNTTFEDYMNSNSWSNDLVACDSSTLKPSNLHMSHSACDVTTGPATMTRRHHSDLESGKPLKKVFSNNTDSGTSSASGSSGCLAGGDFDGNGNTAAGHSSSVGSSFSSAASDSLLKFRERSCRGTESQRSDASSRFSDVSNIYEEVDEYEGISEEEKVALKKIEKEKKAFLTAQEIMTSEQSFVDVLKLLTVDFMNTVRSCRDSCGRPVISDDLLNQIIKYLPQLYHINEDLLRDLKARIKNWDKDPQIADIFMKKGPFLKMYSDYIKDFNSLVELLDETRKKNSDFDKVVGEFEAGPRCAKLAIRHYMLKPIQRIPQYRLLLREYCDHLAPDSVDYSNANAAILVVQEVAEHVNQSMKYGDTLIKMMEIQNSLIGQFEVIKPGRVLLKEGLLDKLSRKEMQPRMFFLFSDVLLYTTPVGGGYRLNNILALFAMKVSKPTSEDFSNEFSIITTQRSFTISAKTAEEREEWLTLLETAIRDSVEKRLSYKQGHLPPSVLNIEVNANEFKIGTKAPVWIPDSRVSMCMICTSEFSVSFRRHHCRGCGKVVCGLCSDFRAPLMYLQFKSERVCHECFNVLSTDVDSMDPVVSESDTYSRGTRRSSEGATSLSKESIKAQFRGVAMSTIGRVKGKRKAAVLHEVQANDDSSEISGYLKVYKNRKWRKMWFVLKAKVLYTFKASEDAAAEESLVLLGYQISHFTGDWLGVDGDLLFELSHPNIAPIIFRTESKASRDKWICAMLEATKCS